MNKINFNSSNPILLVYPRYAGGKFVSNCLSLSHYALPQHSKVIQLLLSIKPSETEYRLRESIVHKTIPPKKNLHLWMSYEFDCREFSGVLREVYFDYKVQENEFNNYIAEVSDCEKKFFIMLHRLGSIPIYRRTWKNANVLVLKNYEEFFNVSLEKKVSGPEITLEEDSIVSLVEEKRLFDNYISCCGTKIDIHNMYEFEDWVSEQKIRFRLEHDKNLLKTIWEYAKPYEYNTVDMSKIFNFNNWSNEIQHLYQLYKFDDFNEDRLYRFWNAYMELHF